MWGKYATISGNISNLPVYTPPPTPTASLTPAPTLTPTPTPSFNASFSDMDSCSGSWWVDIKVINTGAISFKSNSITVRDKGTDTTMTDMSDGFRDIDGCLPSTVVDIIYPGDTYLFSAPAFPHNLAEHDLVVTLTLCSGTGKRASAPPINSNSSHNNYKTGVAPVLLSYFKREDSSPATSRLSRKYAPVK